MSTIDISTTGESSAFAATAASLPRSFRTVADGRADLVSVAGGPTWADDARAAVDAGARGVIISDPSVVSADAVRALRDVVTSANATVVIADRYAADPAIVQHREDVVAHVSTVATLLITETAPTVSVRYAAFSVLRTLRAIGFDATITSSIDHGASITLRGNAGETIISANVAASTAAVGQRVLGFAYGRTVEIVLNGADTARPAHISITTMAGENRLSTVYETADRAAWRRAAEYHRGEASSSTELDGLLADIEAVERLSPAR